MEVRMLNAEVGFMNWESGMRKVEKLGSWEALKYTINKINSINPINISSNPLSYRKVRN